jgi:signal transduction histidine kinase
MSVNWEMLVWDSALRLVFFLISARLVLLQQEFVATRSAKDQAETESRIKSNMISVVSHEYGNILTTMKLSMVLLRESQDQESRRQTMEIMDKAIEHLRSATANFLNLNRLDSGRFVLDIRPAPIRSLARETISFLQPVIAAKRLRLETAFPASAPVPVRADPEALSLIMSNLITNAVKYTPDGGTIAVRIAREESGPPRATFSVEDTGIGISPEDQQRILSGYYRTEEGRKAAKGFGIGLMLVKELVERHGSRLEIDSRPGRGSRFFFSLPVWSD